MEDSPSTPPVPVRRSDRCLFNKLLNLECGGSELKSWSEVERRCKVEIKNGLGMEYEFHGNDKICNAHENLFKSKQKAYCVDPGRVHAKGGKKSVVGQHMVTGKIYVGYFASKPEFAYVFPKSSICRNCFRIFVFGTPCRDEVLESDESEHDQTYQPNNASCSKKIKTDHDSSQLKKDSMALFEIVTKLRAKIRTCKTFAEKKQLLTLAPDSWSNDKVAEQFGVSKYLAKSTRGLIKRGHGTLSVPPKRVSGVLSVDS